MDAIRRAYVYAVALVSLGLGAASVEGVLAWGARTALGLDHGGPVPLLAVAGVIVQVPIWATHWWLARSGMRRHPADRDATTRRAYLVLAVAGAVAATGAGLAAVVRAAIAGPVADAIYGTCAILTAVPILLVHRHALVSDLAAAAPETRLGAVIRRLYLAVAAFVGAAVALDAASGLLATVIARVAGLGVDASGREASAVADMAGALVAAALAWSTHHGGAILAVAGASAPEGGSPRPARPPGDREALLPTLYRVAILTIAVGATLFDATRVLDWAASHALGPGDPPGDAVDAVGGILAYGAAWWAFRRSLARDVAPARAPGDRDEASTWPATLDRLHRYLVASVALGVGAVGVARLVAIVLDVTTGTVPETGSLARDLRFWVAATATGVPTWLAFWRAPGHPRLDDREVASRPRRAALYVVTFACAVALLTSGVWVAYGALGAILGQPYEFPTAAVGATVVALAAGAFHWRVLVAESRRIAARAPVPGAPSPPPGDPVPVPGLPWAAIVATASGTRVTWHPSAAAARTVTAAAAADGAPWHVVARRDDDADAGPAAATGNGADGPAAPT